MCHELAGAVLGPLRVSRVKPRRVDFVSRTAQRMLLGCGVFAVLGESPPCSLGCVWGGVSRSSFRASEEMIRAFEPSGLSTS